MELDDKIYNKIVKLCKKGDSLILKEKYDKALSKHYEALELVPDPKCDWEVSTWIYASIGETFYLVDENEKALDNFFEVLKCPDWLEKAIINLRIGQCFYELGDVEKAKSYLLQAYMVDGEEVFEDEDEVFLDLVKSIDGLIPTKEDLPLKDFNKKDVSKSELEKTETIDAMGVDEDGDIILKIFDSMDWENEEKHLFLLQEKLNNYIEFVVSEQVFEEVELENDTSVMFSVEFMHEITDNAQKLLEYFEEHLSCIDEYDIDIEWE